MFQEGQIEHGSCGGDISSLVGSVGEALLNISKSVEAPTETGQALQNTSGGSAEEFLFVTTGKH